MSACAVTPPGEDRVGERFNNSNRGILVSAASFEQELKVFGQGVHEATQVFYTYLTIHRLLEKHVEMVTLANSHLLFIRTILGSLRASTYVFIYKIFDKRDDSFSLTRLMRAARAEIEVFGPESFCARKLKNNFHNTPYWLKDSVEAMHVATANDFDEVDAVGEKWRKLFNKKFRLHRNKWYGHREFSSDIEADAALPPIDVQEVELLLAYLNNLDDELTQLLHNGKKIDVAVLDDPSLDFLLSSSQARTTAAAKQFFAKLLGDIV